MELRSIRIEELDISKMSTGWGRPSAKKSVLDKPLSLRGTVFEYGVGVHSDSELVIDLKGAAQKFSAVVGIDDDVEQEASAAFQVLVDKQKAFASPSLTNNDPPLPIEIDITGARELRLITRDEVRDSVWSHADWCDARIELAPGASAQPEAISFRSAPPPVIIKQDYAKPRLHDPHVVGATPGRPFLFRIGATGAGPLTFAADTLPAGLSLDKQSGIISGRIREPGAFSVRITITGREASCTGTLLILAGERSLVQTPPMGWSSWNVWGIHVTQEKIKAAADALISTGLAAHGYHYVNIDDGWEAGRNADGTIVPNDRFPDMKGLGDYIHSRGLKFGIYSSPGPRTCGGFTGSYEHERQDALSYASWGVDYLKYDLCSYGDFLKGKGRDEHMHPYILMRAALDACDRDIVYSLCQYGVSRVWEWGARIGANLWRTTGDVLDEWGWINQFGFKQHPLHPWAGPGHWNDPDMLVVGTMGWGPNVRETRLTKQEQVTHISLWALLAAPLLIGCDLTDLDEWTHTLLTNDEVIAVDQDPLGTQARRVYKRDDAQVWARPLQDGSLAVGLFNAGPEILDVTARWEDLGIAGPHTVRDLWQHRDLGTCQGAYKAEVPPHGVALVTMRDPAQASAEFTMRQSADCAA